MLFGKDKCIYEVMGVISRLVEKGNDGHTILYVNYVVNGVMYELHESMKFKSEAIKIGWFPIGQRVSPKLPNTNVGASVVVLYNPDNPSMAYLRDNVGFMNCLD